jgi:hypothetical protein
MMPSCGPLNKKLVAKRQISGGSRKSLSSVKYIHELDSKPKYTETDVIKMAVANVRAIGGAAQ